VAHLTLQYDPSNIFASGVLAPTNFKSAVFDTFFQKPLNFNGFRAFGIKFRKFEIYPNALLFQYFIV
jgi:hypothetical protein